MSITLTLKEFFDQNDKEPWNGLSVAYRNGVKFCLLGIDPNKTNYIRRLDFSQAWLRGYNQMEEFLSQGHRIVQEEHIKISMHKIEHHYYLTEDGKWTSLREKREKKRSTEVQEYKETGLDTWSEIYDWTNRQYVNSAKKRQNVQGTKLCQQLDRIIYLLEKVVETLKGGSK